MDALEKINTDIQPINDKNKQEWLALPNRKTTEHFIEIIKKYAELHSFSTDRYIKELYYLVKRAPRNSDDKLIKEIKTVFSVLENHSVIGLCEDYYVVFVWENQFWAVTGRLNSNDGEIDYQIEKAFELCPTIIAQVGYTKI